MNARREDRNGKADYTSLDGTACDGPRSVARVALYRNTSKSVIRSAGPASVTPRSRLAELPGPRRGATMSSTSRTERVTK